MAKYLDSIRGTQARIGDGYREYFDLEIYEADGTFLYAREKTRVIQRETDLCGYFVIVTSSEMTAKEALELYKSRDESEKLFRGDKSYLGNRSLRTHNDRTASGKIFTEFIALIIRCRMYVLISEALERMDTRPGYMNVTAALKELEKIELIKGLDGLYRLDHAVTKTQKVILSAFRMDENSVRKSAGKLAEMMKTYDSQVMSKEDTEADWHGEEF